MEIKQKELITNKEKKKKAYLVAFNRDLVGISFEMNMNSLKQDLEEIENPVKSEGRKDGE
jgi:hypothetical protein